MKTKFQRFSTNMAQASGTPWAFLTALALVSGWFVTGFYFKWSESHSLFINTCTTIVTFLMTFVIQSSQNRDSRAMQLKLNELIRTSKARNQVIAAEDADEGAIAQLRQEFKQARDEGDRS